MNTEKIKELVAILEDSSVNFLEVSEGDFHLKLGKNAPTETTGEAAITETAPMIHSGVAVKSPMVGVFYAASSPGAEPFVQKGQQVAKGQVLCIIEAMKLMNEITAERDGVITDICAADGDIVEFGQPLFYIQ